MEIFNVVSEFCPWDITVKESYGHGRNWYQRFETLVQTSVHKHSKSLIKQEFSSSLRVSMRKSIKFGTSLLPS